MDSAWNPALRPNTNETAEPPLRTDPQAEDDKDSGLAEELDHTSPVTKHVTGLAQDNFEGGVPLPTSANGADSELSPSEMRRDLDQSEWWEQEDTMAHEDHSDGEVPEVGRAIQQSPVEHGGPTTESVKDSSYVSSGEAFETSADLGAWGISQSRNTSGEEENSRASSQGQDAIDGAFAALAKDPAQEHIAEEVDIAATFPDVPSLPNNKSLSPPVLSRSQAEDVIEKGNLETEETAATSGNSSNDCDASAMPAPGPDDEAGFFSNKFAPSDLLPPSQDDETARFEEGLPLVAHSNHEVTFQEKGHPEEFTSPQEAEDDDAAFFAKASESVEEAHSSRPQPLDRKPTSQVLESMQYAPSEVNHTSLEVGEERPSLRDLTGGGIAVSTQTVKSQVLAEQLAEEKSASPKDEDLSELWKAALEDEDLLEEDDTTIDPSQFFEDDGEGFLEDESVGSGQTQVLPESTTSPILQPVRSREGEMQGFSKPTTESTGSRNPYTPSTHALGLSAVASSYYDSQSPQSASLPNGIPDPQTRYTHLATLPTPARPQMQSSAQSFADKSKGGYTSPYDLPMDVRPRKRAVPPTGRAIPEGDRGPQRPPPPRSSSMYSGAPLPQAAQSPAHIPTSSRPTTSTSASSVSDIKNSPSTSSFFEELVPPSKPRPTGSTSRASMPPSHSAPSPALPPQVTSPPQSTQGNQYYHHDSASAQNFKLMPPDRLSLFGDPSLQKPPRQQMPAMNSRYSPAPPQSSNAPPPSNRYVSSPAVPPRPPSAHASSHHPRTSSPLAQNPITLKQQPSNASYDPFRTRLSSNGSEAAPSVASIVPRYAPQEQDQAARNDEHRLNRPYEERQNQYRQQMHASPPSTHLMQAPPSSSSPSTSSYTMYTPGPDSSSPDGPPIQQHSSLSGSNTELARGLPKRSQTQSPNARKPNGIPAALRPPLQRPASVSNYGPSLPSYETPKSLPDLPSVREQKREVAYVRPSDGRELDSLERWKGCPIVSFGFGGTVVKMFPQHIPRYAAGQKVPMMKCSHGEVKIEQGKTFSLEESIATFPGPLKAKGKKKEVLDWLERKLQRMESDRSIIRNDRHVLPDQNKCHEERVLLWKIMTILVEYDGILEGNVASEQAVRAVLSPELNQGDAVPIPQSTSNAALVGITRRTGSSNVSDSVRSDVLEEIRKALLRGEREKAVWHAVDNRLWAHALLLSSTLDKTISKQVAQEFVRQEVKTFGENTEALSALYQVFAGNLEESIDELVPPSARAGLQMVSKSAITGPTKNALDGLDRWRETLTLILSNRTADDGKALFALGQLLAGYGRTEAAHICYIFAKTPGLFGGPNDPQVSVALLGADHLRRPFDYGRDFDSILLTEVHDFARSTLASPSVATISPHLQSYRLYHAMVLAEYGFKSEAQQYCDTIFSTLKSTTKPSPYYHSLLVGALENLQDRLRQAPRDSSGSWISKPSIDKVSGSIWAKFNQYVAGDEEDTGSSTNGKAQEPAVGPFARVSGDSPTLSRAPSSNDLFNTYSPSMGRAPMPALPTSNSRYAPANVYTPRSSLDQQRHSLQDEPKPSHSDSLRPAPSPQQYSSRPSSSAGLASDSHVPLQRASSYAPRSQSYLPTPSSHPEYATETLLEEPAPSTTDSYSPEPQKNSSANYDLRPFPGQSADAEVPSAAAHPPHEPQLSSYEFGSAYGLQPSDRESTSAPYQSQLSFDNLATSHNLDSHAQDPSQSYEPQQYSYEPPSSTGYEPPSYDTPSYDPNASQAESSPTDQKPRRSVMDLDEEDDFEARAAALHREEKARKDREADEAFRKAAEADAQKDKAPKLNSKKSWFGGGWFAGKDKSNDMSAPNAPIKVKLGEENSFYYDEQLKKWVNKKGGNTEAAAGPAPPPPKGPPSRSVSASGGPPPSSTPVPPVPPLPPGMGAANVAMRAVSGPTPSPQFPSSHPSRTSSPAVNVVRSGEESSPPSGPPSAPPSRPATSQGGASNIDDLIGLPQARKGGTVRKGKKGRGYVDVMAKE